MTQQGRPAVGTKRVRVVAGHCAATSAALQARPPVSIRARYG
ncbi:hypothetical protein [Actinoplanes sp. CA-252034]